MAQKPSKGGKPIPPVIIDRNFTPPQIEELLVTLQERFETNMSRHDGIAWNEVRSRVEASPDVLSTLFAMERTGGEPDVIGYDAATEKYLFYDCSTQSPQGRRSICYDGPAQAEREKSGVYPGGNAVDIAAAMGVELLNEEEYRLLQTLGEFDTTTESWIATPPEIRKRGGAIFADRRYGRVFVFHNSAPSFYRSRGFRGSVKV